MSADPVEGSVRLRLYVTGRTARSEAAVENIRAICAARLDHFQLDIVDVLEDPDIAERERVLVTPTLDKLFPLPPRRIIGDLSDVQAVVRVLGLASTTGGSV